MSPNLRVDWCSTEAARYAVMTWHYSKNMPTPGKWVKLGIWWKDRFAGAVVFSRPCRNQHLMFDLKPEQVCELGRVAMDRHEGFRVTEVVAAALVMLKKQCPGMRLVVSFADPDQGHVGRIYQAGNWIYTGVSGAAKQLVHQGKKLHRRQFTGRGYYGKPKQNPPKGSVWIPVPPKHRYVMPLDKGMRRQVLKLALPYPQPADASVGGAGHQSGQAVQPLPSASPAPAPPELRRMPPPEAMHGAEIQEDHRTPEQRDAEAGIP